MHLNQRMSSLLKLHSPKHSLRYNRLTPSFQTSALSWMANNSRDRSPLQFRIKPQGLFLPVPNWCKMQTALRSQVPMPAGWLKGQGEGPQKLTGRGPFLKKYRMWHNLGRPLARKFTPAVSLWTCIQPKLKWNGEHAANHTVLLKSDQQIFSLARLLEAATRELSVQCYLPDLPLETMTINNFYLQGNIYKHWTNSISKGISYLK